MPMFNSPEAIRIRLNDHNPLTDNELDEIVLNSSHLLEAATHRLQADLAWKSIQTLRQLNTSTTRLSKVGIAVALTGVVLGAIQIYIAISH
jgi:hypothetical protein